MFIDTHAHLFKEYYDNIEEIINKAKTNRVNKIIISGYDIKSNIEALELVEKYTNLYCTLGFHPNELDNFKEEDIIWLEQNLTRKKVVGIGEIGLDYHYENYDKEKQKQIFIKQINIAKKLNKPIVVHSRDSIQDTYNIIKESKIVANKCVMHCYSGSLEMASSFTKLGVYLGIGGISTFKNAHNIIKVIKEIPLQYILLETDCPYLTPEPFRKEKNDPSFIPIIANKVAEIKGLDIKSIEKQIKDNTLRVFDILDDM